ncbi:ATP-binding protein [uncultured Desulfovibrio sp.]|uniref:Lon protease family protein n=1 Tax=uncultured Desulfovibrio sp. TaxID=167968 RepID=UPI002633AF17|nr:ATP-binding protein [uncultured Desulfovibrio sp.]
MLKIQPLPSSRLHATFDPAKIPWDDSSSIPLPRNGGNGRNPFQPRAMQALDLALNIHSTGYNVYLSGEPHLGRCHMLLNYLRPLARKATPPPDLVYVHNFADQDSPQLFSLPAGMGKKLKQGLNALVEAISKELMRRLEAGSFVKQRAKLMDSYQKTRTGLLHKMNNVAAHKGFHLEADDSGSLTLYPLVGGKRLADEEFDQLDAAVRLKLKRQGEDVARAISVFVRQLSKVEETFHDEERDLERDVMTQVLHSLLTPLRQKMLKACDCPRLSEYFDALHEDILRNTDAFLPRETPPGPAAPGPDPLHAQPPQEPPLYRYDVNVFVDNSATEGAPIIVEDHPTLTNLLGCIERESELGALVTDFTLIKSGSLHKANGGYLILHIDDVLQHPAAWEGLLRALRSNSARMEDNSDAPDSGMRTKGISPEALPLNLKVILIGCDDLYETLLVNDDRFGKLFRIKAQMDDVTERNAAGVRYYLSVMARIIHDEELLPFDRTALAWLVDLGSHICEDQRRLSLKFTQLREMMIEANALATMRKQTMIGAEILEEAYAARAYRVNLTESIFMEEYDREMIKVRTSGHAVGQVNGLSVMSYGDFEFGLPHRIACTVGVGHEGIIDLEREAELGGPIHTKAMMILKSCLTNLFARRKPLVLSGSLYFEQSYAGIEGDSASGAELAALLSALAEVPVRLDLAFTGAVSHTGQIMAVGGVTRKIEGFFKVCARHGLTGTQGVLIPADNVDHLMLAPDVLQAVEDKKFAIYPITCIEEALFLLTGLPAGKRRKDDTFTPGSLYALVDRRLEQLGEYAQNAFDSKRRKRRKN